MKPTFWTCGCGHRQITPRAPGTPVCDACGLPAPFTIAPPKGQGGFAFEEVPDGK